jgi:hypothetical protein
VLGVPPPLNAGELGLAAYAIVIEINSEITIMIIDRIVVVLNMLVSLLPIIVAKINH